MYSTLQQSARRSRGFTLIELILVVAIMVVVASIAAPAVHRTFAQQALQKGADRLRVAMGQARVKAIKNGEEYAVFFMPEGSWFGVAPFYSFPEQAQIAQKRQQFVTNGNYTDYEKDLMPRGVRFVAGETAMDGRAAAAAADVGGAESLRSILFYPDGTSQDARIILQNDKGSVLQVELRGLTGISKTTRMAGNIQ